MTVKNKIMNATAIGILSVAVSACSMSTPSQVSVDRIQVSQSEKSIVLERDAINDSTLMRIADDYKRTSEGGMNVYISYPADLVGAKGTAESLGHDYLDVFETRGVRDVNLVTVPMQDTNYDERVIVSFRGYDASVPKDCSRITGNFGAEGVHDMKDYQIGCEHMRYISQMVSDPRDLLGRTSTQDADSRRSGNVVERYGNGEPLEDLPSNGASDIGGAQ